MNNSIPAWQYGETGNGSKGVGFYQNTQGARLRFTPVLKQYGDMSLKVKADRQRRRARGLAVQDSTWILESSFIQKSDRICFAV